MARHGENIRKRKDGRWEGRYKAFDEAKGRHVYRSVYGRDYGEAREKLSRARLGAACGGDAQGGGMGGSGNGAASAGGADVDSRAGRVMAGKGGAGGGDGVLFSQAAEEWLAQTCGRRKHSTYIKYCTVYRAHLAGTIGPCRLHAGAAEEMQGKISDHLSGEGMSGSLKKSIVCVANQILSFANGMYSSGVPLLDRPPAGAGRKGAGAFTVAEQAKILGCVCGGADRFKTAVLLCLYAGLRLGELCALRWDDIDFKGMALMVGRTVQRIAVPGHLTKTILLETAPKSGSSGRAIPLTPGILEALSRLNNGQPYVFGGEGPLEPRTMQYRFRKILAEAGVDARNFHALRHTFATNCVESGMDVKSLSGILGHSDVKVTMNRYVHPTMDAKRRQLGELAGFYGQICGQAA